MRIIWGQVILASQVSESWRLGGLKREGLSRPHEAEVASRPSAATAETAPAVSDADIRSGAAFPALSQGRKWHSGAEPLRHERTGSGARPQPIWHRQLTPELRSRLPRS